MREIEPILVVLVAADAGERLDRVLAGKGVGLSRAQLQRLFAEGRISVEGEVAGVRDKARAGARVLIEPLPPPPSAAEPENIPIEILFEDAQLIVIMKAAGMVVHPAPGHAGGTLVNALRYHRELEEQEGSTERPGIVHRLDKDTSGVMVVAKTMQAREGLMAQFKTHDIEREYQAIVVGHPEATFTVDTLHGRHPRDRKKFTGKVVRGKRAVTHVELVERLHGASLVRCRLETGRTHQIRVHLAEHGFPIVADPVYGRPARDARLVAATEAIGRQALHARVLGFRHPQTGEALRFVAEPPEDFRRALSLLRDGA